MRNSTGEARCRLAAQPSPDLCLDNGETLVYTRSFDVLLVCKGHIRAISQSSISVDQSVESQSNKARCNSGDAHLPTLHPKPCAALQYLGFLLSELRMTREVAVSSQTHE